MGNITFVNILKRRKDVKENRLDIRYGKSHIGVGDESTQISFAALHHNVHLPLIKETVMELHPKHIQLLP